MSAEVIFPPILVRVSSCDRKKLKESIEPGSDETKAEDDHDFCYIKRLSHLLDTPEHKQCHLASFKKAYKEFVELYPKESQVTLTLKQKHGFSGFQNPYLPSEEQRKEVQKKELVGHHPLQSQNVSLK